MSADRLSVLLHDLDDLPVAPPPATVVRARGTSIRRRRQGAAGAGMLALAAAGIVGVGALSGAQDDTSLRPAPFATAPAESEQGALPVEGAPPVRDGHDLGFVTELTETDEGLALVLDRVQWFDQEQLRAEAVAEGRDPAEAQASEARNAQTDLHRYPVSPDAAVTLTVGLAPPDLQGGSVPSTLAELRTLLADPAVASTQLFDVEVEDGVVVRIDHSYAA